MINGHWQQYAQELNEHWRDFLIWEEAARAALSMPVALGPRALRVAETVGASLLSALVVGYLVKSSITSEMTIRLEERISAVERQRTDRSGQRDRESAALNARLDHEISALSARSDASDVELRKQIADMRLEINAIYRWVQERKR